MPKHCVQSEEMLNDAARSRGPLDSVAVHESRGERVRVADTVGYPSQITKLSKKKADTMNYTNWNFSHVEFFTLNENVPFLISTIT